MLIWELLRRPTAVVSTVCRIELYLVWEHEPSLPVMHSPVIAYRPPCRTAFWRVTFVEYRYPKSMTPSTSSKKIDNEIANSTTVWPESFAFAILSGPSFTRTTFPTCCQIESPSTRAVILIYLYAQASG